MPRDVSPWKFHAILPDQNYLLLESVQGKFEHGKFRAEVNVTVVMQSKKAVDFSGASKFWE